MDNSKNINKLRKEYFVILDGKPVCPPFNDEPDIFDKQVLPLYRALCVSYPDKVRIVCVTTFEYNDEKAE